MQLSSSFAVQVIQLALINEYSLKDGKIDGSGKQGQESSRLHGDHRLKNYLSDLLSDFLVISPMVQFSDSFHTLIKKMDGGRKTKQNPADVNGNDRSRTGQVVKNQTLSGHQLAEESAPNGRIYSYVLDIQVHIVCILHSLLFLSSTSSFHSFPSFRYSLQRQVCSSYQDRLCFMHGIQSH